MWYRPYIARNGPMLFLQKGNTIVFDGRCLRIGGERGSNAPGHGTVSQGFFQRPDYLYHQNWAGNADLKICAKLRRASGQSARSPDTRIFSSRHGRPRGSQAKDTVDVFRLWYPRTPPDRTHADPQRSSHAQLAPTLRWFNELLATRPNLDRPLPLRGHLVALVSAPSHEDIGMACGLCVMCSAAHTSA